MDGRVGGGHEEERMNPEDSKGSKQLVLRLRWVTILITSYLVLFAGGISSPRFTPVLLISVYLLSNILAYLLPASYFVKRSFFCGLLLFDTFFVSLGIYITPTLETDFYLVYFLVILIASIARSFKLLMVTALVICAIYGWILWSQGGSARWLEEGMLLRIPFIFIMNLFYGFLIHSFEERTKKIKSDLHEKEESEERYRQIVESTHDAVVILNGEGRIKFFNRRLPPLTQYTPEELTGAEWKNIVKGFEMNELTHSLQRSISEWEPVIHEAEVFQKNGEKRKVEVSATHLFLSPDQTHTILYLKDITEKRQMEEKLIRSEKLRALGEMAAGIAHDFNNILGAILGRVELIRLGWMSRRGGADGMTEEALFRELEIVKQAAIEGAHTVKRFQEFTRSQTDESKFVFLDVNEIVDAAVDLMKTKIKDEADAKGIEIRVERIKEEVPPIMGNPAELKEVFLNLLLNSIDAMPEGGTITLKTEHKNGHVSIEASDDGVGMSEYVKERLFEPFFTTKDQRSGLGLSVSYGTIHRHHGAMEVESQKGRGSTFIIRLPIPKEGEG
ncbi:MAG: PAS domain S-box protein [Thermodesulfobacteriota bacterium]|nr:PAS domain S-box protein [Thermodesulfobacteriota bacterium]